jgi:dihydropteroate synthase
MSLNCAGKLLNLHTPVIMAILNITPDSFYDGNKFFDTEWKAKVKKVLDLEPEIVDVGGMSSRPGALVISPEDEWNRILNIVRFIKKEYPETLISIDTIHSSTAIKTLDLGVHIINDISSGNLDSDMMESISSYKPAYTMMHMNGTPSTMQSNTNYENLMLELIEFFKVKISLALSYGLDNLIIDPGFGFSKTIDQNYKLLNNLHLLQLLSKYVLVGLSRKSMIYKVLGLTPKESLNGTSVLHLKALQQGAKILRVHDVKEARETINLFQKLSVNK